MGGCRYLFSDYLQCDRSVFCKRFEVFSGEWAYWVECCEGGVLGSYGVDVERCVFGGNWKIECERRGVISGISSPYKERSFEVGEERARSE